LQKKSMVSFEFCNFSIPEHRNAMTQLLNHYMEDPMGDHPPLNKLQQLRLVDDLSKHPTAEVLFLLYDNRYVGMATTFVNYSTFNLKPYLYIHDVVVLNDYRGKGLGKAIIAELIRISEERGYCKITLEVREDNPGAQRVYNSMGFEECEPRMLFWTKKL
jgi:ribosomal protein S18 acetylase RimI-like enzyme